MRGVWPDQRLKQQKGGNAIATDLAYGCGTACSIAFCFHGANGCLVQQSISCLMAAQLFYEGHASMYANCERASPPHTCTVLYLYSVLLGLADYFMRAHHSAESSDWGEEMLPAQCVPLALHLTQNHNAGSCFWDAGCMMYVAGRLQLVVWRLACCAVQL